MSPRPIKRRDPECGREHPLAHTVQPSLLPFNKRLQIKSQYKTYSLPEFFRTLSFNCSRASTRHTGKSVERPDLIHGA